MSRRGGEEERIEARTGEGMDRGRTGATGVGAPTPAAGRTAGELGPSAKNAEAGAPTPGPLHKLVGCSVRS